MSLITEISNWTTKVLGNIIDDKTNKLYSSLLTNDFIREFGSEVENVSELSGLLSLSPLEERHSLLSQKTKIASHEESLLAIDNFFDFFLNLNEQNLVQTVEQGQIIIDGVMLPIAVQNMDVDNKIQDPKDLGVKPGGDVKKNLLIPSTVTDALRLPLGYEPTTIVIDAIIPNGPNTSPNIKMSALWKLHKTASLVSKDELKSIKLQKLKKSAFADTHRIWNPFINSCGISLVTMRGIAPTRSVNHDGIVIKITMREDILSAFYDQNTYSSSSNNEPPRATKIGEIIAGTKIGSAMVDLSIIDGIVNKL